MAGGVFGLLGLIQSHRGAVEYDLRSRFGLGLRDVGWTISLWEMARLVTILRSDPSSAIASALEGWDYPIDRTALAVLDLHDRFVEANSGKKKPPPHPGRPWKRDDRQRERKGNAAGRSRAEVVAILNAHGHELPV